MSTSGLKPRISSFLTSTVFILLAAVVVITAGCGEEEDVGAIFTYSELGDATAIDPALVEESVGANVTNYLFDGLVLYDSETGAVVPGVAEEWQVNEDATEFTFTLRDDVKFSNGRDLTADDFVYAWTRSLSPDTASPMAMTILEPVAGAIALAEGEADTLSGVEAVDDRTLKVVLEYPLAEFVTFVGHPVCAPIPREEVENTDGDFSEMPVGNGPFMLKEWKRDQEIVLEKNPEYYGEEAAVEQVVVKIIPDPATAVEELKAGNIDAVKVLPPGMDEGLREDESVTIYEQSLPKIQFVAFNMSMSPWNENKSLREALNYAIDKETIAKVVLIGQAMPADSIVPMGIPGHQPGLAPYQYDIEAARSKLEEAGYPEGQGLPELTLTYPTDGPFGEVAQAIQSQLNEIGVEVQLSGLEYGDFLDRMTGQELSLFIISWSADYPSPDTFLYTLFSSDLIGPGAPNVSQYSNEEVDELLNEARSTTDEDSRLRLYNEAETKILEDAPVITIVNGNAVIPYSDRVTNFVLTTLGDIALNEVSVSES